MGEQDMKKTGMKKVLVIGATGFLGSKLMECFGKAFSVIGTHYGPPGPNTIALDITDAAQVQQVFAQTDPDIVILTSALTDVDLCERDQSLAWSTNVQGVANIAAHCEHRMLIFYSTDAVFDGNRGNYAEHDRPNPINYYGRTKMEAEGIVQKIPHHLILRSYLIYGEQDSPRFVNRVIRELREGHTVQAVTDADGTPTFIDDIADATLQLVQREKTGLYHVAGSTVLSFYDMAMTIAEVFGFSKKLILPIKNAELQRSAKRPVHASLNIEKVSREGIRMSTFREGIEKIATRVGA
ncbi:MAG TPA: NAD(P)-dependent oxidoreductase, partial [Candidatus Nanoarchaeia archaeon]|nr:NAD(P)-dependent oxidoreductase [Candidatus Nanoarchaeia archaeon]